MAGSTMVGIWGGAHSGKTTFLAALRHATLQDTTGRWKIVGKDDDFPGSSAFMATVTTQLRDGEFPGATGAQQEYGFIVSGVPTRSPLDFLRDKVGSPREQSFVLRFLDVPGRDFSHSPKGDRLWQYLADCQGLIYLFDPALEQQKEKNFDYVQRAADYVYQLVDAAGKLVKQHLPHFLAVCVAKYDEPQTFDKLRQAGLITWNTPDGAPDVINPQAALLALEGKDKLTVPTIKSFFLPGRTRYFTVSSVGFYRGEGGRVSHQDCYNVVDTQDGPRIRGVVAPVNVFAPLMWLEEQIRRTFVP